MCLNLEKEENGSIKGQDSAFYSLFIKIQKYFQSSRKEVGKLWLQVSVMKVMPTTQMPGAKDAISRSASISIFGVEYLNH